MELESDTLYVVYTAATLIGSLTVCWIGIHAFFRIGWALPVASGKKHRQTAGRTLAHAVAAGGFLLLSFTGRGWGPRQIGVLAPGARPGPLLRAHSPGPE